MKRLSPIIVVFLLLVGLFAQRPVAQLFNPPIYFPAIAGSSYTGPGNVVLAAVAFWSCSQAYNSTTAAANTKMCNYIRASDSHTCDVLTASNGNPGNTANCSTGGDNGQTLSSWLSGTTAVITEVYDQTGNGNHFTQTTNADRPPITVSCINTFPCMQFTGSPVRMSNPANFSWTGVTGAISVESVSEQVGSISSGNGEVFYSANLSSTCFLEYANISGYKFYNGCGGSSASLSAAQSAWHIASSIFNPTSGAGAMNVDGTDSTGLNIGGGPGIQSNYLGFYNPSPTYFVGNIAEIGVWTNITTGIAFTSTQRANLCSNASGRYALGLC